MPIIMLENPALTAYTSQPADISKDWVQWCNLGKLGELSLSNQIKFYEIFLEKKVSGNVTPDEAESIKIFLDQLIKQYHSDDPNPPYEIHPQLQRIMFTHVDTFEAEINNYYFEASQFIMNTANKKQTPYAKEEITISSLAPEQVLKVADYMRMSILAYELFHDVETEPPFHFVEEVCNKTSEITSLMKRYGYEYTQKTWKELLDMHIEVTFSEKSGVNCS